MFEVLRKNEIFKIWFCFFVWSKNLRGIHKLRWQARGREELTKCQRYYISLCSKLVNEGGDQKFSKSCQRTV